MCHSVVHSLPPLPATTTSYSLAYLTYDRCATMRINIYDQVQALLSVEPLDRLRAYLSQAILPPMKLSPKAPPLPPAGHHSHKNSLSVVPKQYRLLEKMYIIENADFWPVLNTGAHIISAHSALSCRCAPSALNLHVTQDKLAMRDEDDFENVTIPCQPNYQLAAHPPTKPANLGQYVTTLKLHSPDALTLHVF